MELLSRQWPEKPILTDGLFSKLLSVVLLFGGGIDGKK
jgi:hypothetical protein